MMLWDFDILRPLKTSRTSILVYGVRQLWRRFAHIRSQGLHFRNPSGKYPDFDLNSHFRPSSSALSIPFLSFSVHESNLQVSTFLSSPMLSYQASAPAWYKSLSLCRGEDILGTPRRQYPNFRLSYKWWRHELWELDYGRLEVPSSQAGIPLGGFLEWALTPKDDADMDHKLDHKALPRVAEPRTAPAERTVGMKCPNHNTNASEEMAARSCWARTRTPIVALDLECSHCRSTWSLRMCLQY